MSYRTSPTRHASEDIGNVNESQLQDKENDIAPGVKTPGSSCKALRHAVSNLYRFDDFICEDLGSGFFSTVYKVKHKVTNEIMVLKKNTNLTNRPNMLREVQLMNRLKHPNILSFIGVCVHEGQLHALTQFINGGSLDTVIQNLELELSWTERFSLGADTARGMKYLHAQSIMHRDLTSKNVLVKFEADNVKRAIVADFGLSTNIPDPFDVSGKKLSIVGSPYWMAPECINGERYNEKADIFSFGIILCEIIARINADPDLLPRTYNFGVDYVAFSKMAENCPLHFIHLAFNCCQFESKKRPSFNEIVDQMEQVRTRSKMASVLMDINKLTVNSAEKSVDKSILDRIIIGRGLKRNMSDDAITVRMSDFRQVEYVVDDSPSYSSVSSSCSSEDEEHDTEETPVNTPQLTDDSETGAVTKPVTKPVSSHNNSTQDSLSFPVTPLIVGEVMSKDDPFYTPYKENPFPSRFKDACAKLVGSMRENWLAWFDLPTPRNLLPPPQIPKGGRDDSSWVRHRATPKLHRSHSLPGSPFLLKREVDRYHFEAAQHSPAGYRMVPGAVRGYNSRKASEVVDGAMIGATLGLEDTVETRSDDSSSADSAVDLTVKDMKRSRRKPWSCQRKLSMEKSGLVSGRDRGAVTREGCVSPTAILTHYLESKILDEALHGRLGSEPKLLGGGDEERFPHSFSSSESCLSVDECSMLSPTSSYSSYGEDSELWTRAQFEFYEHRLRSREKFQELVRRFEAKHQTGSSAKKDSEESQSVPRTDTRSLFLHERLEHSDPHLERKFKELRRKWENKEQISSLSLHPKSSHRLSPKPPKHNKPSSLLNGAKPKVKAAKQTLSPRPVKNQTSLN